MRKYTFNKAEYPSVTSIIGLLDKSDALIPWAVNCAVTYIDQNKEQDFEILLQNARNEWRTIRDTAADIGKEVHNLIEQYIKQQIAGIKPKPVHHDNDKVVHGFLAFLEWEKENVDCWTMAEKPIFSEKYGYAGTLDAVVKLKTGLLYVIDFKSSKGFYDGFAKQIAAYRSAILECSGKNVHIVGPYGEYNIEYPIINNIDGMGILRLDKLTGEPEWKDYSKQYERKLQSFLELLEFYYADKKRRLKNNIFVK